jgi:hypothetical protein
MSINDLTKHLHSPINRGVVLLLSLLLLSGVISWAQSTRPNITFEAESGTRSGLVSIISDSGASGGGALRFDSATPPPVGTGRCQHTTTRICYNGELLFTNGVNTPWIEWNNDFGGGGVVRNRTAISNRFAGFSNTGSHVVRWWLFEGGAWQINRDGTGRPTSLNSAIYADIDEALVIAEERNLYYNFTLFSGMNNGHMPSSWRTNTTHRQALADVLAPLFARYKDNPRVMSWEIWNEPEWDYWNGVDGTTEEQATNMASRIITVIRREAPKAMTTVGQANISSLGQWRNVDLDFDSPHWYDPMTGSNECAICSNASVFQSTHGTTRPIVIGEYYQSPGTATQNLARHNEWYNRGYAGAWGWSLFSENTGDGLPIDLGAMTTFGQQHNDLGPK